MKTVTNLMMSFRQGLLTIVIFACASGIRDLHAQFVNIPDPVFRNYIATLDPTAITGTNMDTTNVTVTTITTLFIPALGITDLTGIEYFDNLQSLTCHSNNITSFSSIYPNGTHEFPAGMTFLNCSLNPGLQNLPLMPSSINIINANYCTALNSIYPLPNGGALLTDLLLHATGINSLPTLIGTALNFLDVDSCLFIGCLPQLPDSMHTLHALQSGIICLPNLPASPLFVSNIGTNVCNSLFPVMATDPTCNNYCDGDATVISSFANLVYTWSNGYIDTNANGVSSELNLCSGSYNVSIAPVAGGCPAFCSFILNNPAMPQLGQPVINPVQCNGDSTWIYYSGNPPFTFIWNTGTINDSVFLPAGNYSVTEYTGVCPVAPASFTVIEPPPIQAINSGSITICDGSSLCPIETGGTSPYTYLWSNFISSQCLSNLTAGIYFLTVTDQNGCIGIDTFIVNVPTLITIQLNAPVFCNGMTPLNLFAFVSGGVFPYFYTWSDGSTLDHSLVDSTGAYSITVTDAIGCSATAMVSTVNIQGPLIAGITVPSLPSCVTCDGIVTGNAGPFPGPFTTTFFPSSGLTNIGGPSYSGFCADTLYAILVEDGAGGSSCESFILPDSCVLVWPGDANHDGIADNLDLLSVGVAFGSSGPLRSNASNSWVGQPAISWSGSLASGTNYKHVDCNGDGLINYSDTIAILLNYGSVHPLKPFPLPLSLVDPYLYFDLTIDTIGTSQTLQIPLNLGTVAIPIDSLYGIAFTITYDTALVKPDSISLDFSNSWIGGGSNNLVYIQHNDPVNGKLYCAVSRINQTDTSGYGTLGLFTIVTTDNVSGKLTMPIYDTLRFELSDVTAISHTEQFRPVQVLNDSIIVEDLTSISELENISKLIKIYPSPAKEYLTISVPAGFNYSRIRIYNQMGIEIKNYVRNKNSLFKLNLQEYGSGIYSIAFISNKGIIVKRFGVIR